MDLSSFQQICTCDLHLGNDVLSTLKKHAEKSSEIQQGMTPQEISEVVADKIIAVVKQQFLATEQKFSKVGE